MLNSSRTTNLLLVVMIAVGIAIVAMLASGAVSGPLDPPGSPASTGKPLNDVLSAWNQFLPADDGPTPCNSSRFSCVLNDGGVLDRETGLIWERNTPVSLESFVVAQLSCIGSTTGSRLGWRLPTLEEMTSLIDPNAGAAPFLPPGHPFNDVSLNTTYWTASRSDATTARMVSFEYSIGAQNRAIGTSRYWCVRGGYGYDG